MEQEDLSSIGDIPRTGSEEENYFHYVAELDLFSIRDNAQIGAGDEEGRTVYVDCERK